MMKNGEVCPRAEEKNNSFFREKKNEIFFYYFSEMYSLLLACLIF